MGLFDSSKKIYRKDFKKILRDVPKLSKKEQAYVNDVFEKSLKGGLTEFELKKEIDRIKHVSDDPLEPSEVKRVKNKVMEHLK